jgi:nitroimidazol reductase NimA-like FMN-containing flavoprotein (pyridoxamine 5'-phosphate oxidase superfamily)
MTEEVKQKALEILNNHNAINIATTGGEYSPWILGAYFGNDGLDIYCLLETAGKSYSNIIKNNNVAIVISENNAMKDFLQGYGKAIVLPDSEEPAVRKRVVDKMPSFQTYTPVVPVKIEISKFFVTSLENNWFPAKVLEQEMYT